MYFYGSDIDYTSDAVDSIYRNDIDYTSDAADSISPPHTSILQMRRVA